MSLSQKHAGKVLVPWFNSNEWNFVYRSTFSENIEDQKQALDIIKIWKIRTPILSAGIEGTLIILETILTNEELPSDRISQIYSLALVRFLNICAANNEKQGTFSKSVQENELPKWLIGIRHDIAHGHQLPSLSLLKLCVDCCFEWLRLKYWEPQSKVISDYIIKENSDSEMLTSLLKIYVPFNSTHSRNKFSKHNQANIIKLEQFTEKKFGKTFESTNEALKFIEELISAAFKNDAEKNVGKSVAEMLVNEKGLLRRLYEVDGSEEIISGDSLQTWENILVTLHENRYLFNVLDKLYDVTSSITLARAVKVTAALWISELVYSLDVLKKKKLENECFAGGIVNGTENSHDRKHIEFADTDFFYVEEAREFQNKVLAVPNDCAMYFLEKLMRYNENSEEYIKCTIDTILQISSQDQMVVDAGSEIYTIESLDLDNTNGMDLDNTMNNSGSDGGVNSNEKPVKRWRRVTDMSVFKNCPLGRLSHQDALINPVLNWV